MVVLSGAYVRRLGGSLRPQAFAVLIAVTESYFLGANWVYQTVTFDEATWMVALYCGRRTAQAILRDDWRSYPSSRLGGFARKSISQPVDNAGDAVLDQRHIEIDEQAEAFVRQPEIGQELLLVDWGYQLDGFNFNDDLVFDHQIGSESGIDAEILIDHRDRLLLGRAQTPAAQFMRQDRVIDRFEQAWAKRCMNAESGVDDLLGYGVFVHISFHQFLAKSRRRKGT
jgi:hypothetical protein